MPPGDSDLNKREADPHFPLDWDHLVISCVTSETHVPRRATLKVRIKVISEEPMELNFLPIWIAVKV